MNTRTSFCAIALAALLTTPLSIPAQAAGSLPTASMPEITVTALANGAADDKPGDSFTGINVVPPPKAPATSLPKAPAATPPTASKPQDGWNTFYGWLFVCVVLYLLYLAARRKSNNDRPHDIIIYGDPEDYPRPRGRTLSPRQARDLRDQHRIPPTIDETSLGEFNTNYRGQPGPGFAEHQDNDPMKPQYQRQSHAMLILPTARDKKSFADVAGQPEAIARLQEICLWLKEPEIYNRHNAKLPRGILLVGPPGTGKTLCAQALAGETHGSMFSIAASSFVEMYVGVGASRVRSLFADAKAQRRQTGKPVIVFIDELDAVGGARSSGTTSNSEREQTLNQLLVEMDGFSKNEGIIVIAATNRPDMIDPALRRKGRFDLEVHVDLPDVNGREQILLVHSRDKVLAPEVDFKLLAKRTFGMSGADLAAAANEAATLAAREQARLEAAEREATAKVKAAAAEVARARAAEAAKAPATAATVAGDSPAPGAQESAPAGQSPAEGGIDTGGKVASETPANPAPAAIAAIPAQPSIIGKITPISEVMFDEAISIVESGDARRERFQSMTIQDKKQTAFHELGHALVIHKTGGDPITKITILPRGRALGYVQTHTEGDRWNATDVEMRKRITAAMAGRIAQEMFMQTVDTGASNDFEQANRMARKMVTQFGMSPLGAIFVPDNGMPIGPGLSDKIDEATSKIVQACADEARKILEENRRQISALVDLLIEKETIFGSDFVAVLEQAENTAAGE